MSKSETTIRHEGQPMTDYFAFSNEVRLGRYPGEVVSTHASHWEAVQEMFRLNEAAGMDDRVDDPRE